MIQLFNVGYTYKHGRREVKILNNINMTIEKDEFTCIYGTEYSGLSTMFSILMGLEIPTYGKYIFGRNDISILKEDQRTNIRKQNFGVVLNQSWFFESLSCSENMELMLTYANIPSQDRNSIITSYLNKLELDDYKDVKLDELTLIERKKVQIASALMLAPKFLLVNEPTSHTLNRDRREIMGIIQKLHARGQPIIMFSKSSEIAKHANRVIWLEKGQIKKDMINENPINSRDDIDY